jgi:H+-transporting ATPase
VTCTGTHTFIGRAAKLIQSTKEEGHFQKIINSIGNFLIIISVVMVLVILFVQIFSQGMTFIDALRQVLIITIAAIPVGLPTVMSVTMAVGASELAKKQVIVKRLTAIEELASVSILCSDKTGTLTLNQLSFDKPYLAHKGSKNGHFEGNGELYTEQDLSLAVFLSSEPGAQDAIESAIRKAARERVIWTVKNMLFLDIKSPALFPLTLLKNTLKLLCLILKLEKPLERLKGLLK